MINIVTLGQHRIISLDYTSPNNVTISNYFRKLHHTLLFNGLFQKLDAHPLKKTWESQKFIPHFSLGNQKKLSIFFVVVVVVARVKKTWEFPKYSIIFSTENGNSHFLTFFDIHNWEFPFFKTIFRIPIFKVKI